MGLLRIFPAAKRLAINRFVLTRIMINNWYEQIAKVPPVYTTATVQPALRSDAATVSEFVGVVSKVKTSCFAWKLKRMILARRPCSKSTEEAAHYFRANA